MRRHSRYLIWRFGANGGSSAVHTTVESYLTPQAAFDAMVEDSRIRQYLDGTYYHSTPGEDVFALIPTLGDGRTINGKGALLRYRPSEPRPKPVHSCPAFPPKDPC